MSVRGNFSRRAYLTAYKIARHSPLNTELSNGASDFLNYVVLEVKCTNSEAFSFGDLRSVSEDAVPPQPTVLYYGTEVEISTEGWLENRNDLDRKPSDENYVGRGGFHTIHDYPQSSGLVQAHPAPFSSLSKQPARLLLEVESSNPKECRYSCKVCKDSDRTEVALTTEVLEKYRKRKIRLLSSFVEKLVVDVTDLKQSVSNNGNSRVNSAISEEVDTYLKLNTRDAVIAFEEKLATSTAFENEFV
ncbi:hypothetical protein EVAR_37205_1 [Eumeta japonica]|uniref:Uncharacterized protein n=1 Tax=Eumeta variegata TaxID=151549 RepID=A0A4C1Z2I9_EUMVA|nr:hypothetical protein EVAR_37205_1 [Eumeta japonica]